jgi:hypothetical protein
VNSGTDLEVAWSEAPRRVRCAVAAHVIEPGRREGKIAVAGGADAPHVGLRPTAPHHAGRRRIDAVVSLPSVALASPAAAATPSRWTSRGRTSSAQVLRAACVSGWCVTRQTRSCGASRNDRRRLLEAARQAGSVAVCAWLRCCRGCADEPQSSSGLPAAGREEFLTPRPGNRPCSRPKSCGGRQWPCSARRAALGERWVGRRLWNGSCATADRCARCGSR